MLTINYYVEPEILGSMNKTAKEFSTDIMLWAAISMYEHNKLSLAKAAKLAGYHRYDFESILSKMNIPISNLTFEEVESDLEKLNNL